MSDERMEMPTTQGLVGKVHSGGREINDATAIIDQNTGTLVSAAENLEQLYARLKGDNAPSGAAGKSVVTGTADEPTDAVLPMLTRVARRNQDLTMRVNALVNDLLEIL